jgi:antitoxin component of RelBE/YafQ-DinJ toxin-antitoxin module
VVSVTKYVTVSAKIDAELRKQLNELGIRPSEAIRRSLEREIEEKMRERLRQKIEDASAILSKVGKEAWVKAIRESRDER